MNSLFHDAVQTVDVLSDPLQRVAANLGEPRTHLLLSGISLI